VKALVTGAGGQLGRALARTAPAGWSVTAVARDRLDITSRESVAQVVAVARPDVIINAAAYTAVDRAESEPALARACNAAGPSHLAHAAKACGARLLHVSTDFVFDGASSTPYSPADAACPVSVYGTTKREGELAVLNEAGQGAAILRTAWVYDAVGNNFVSTMLRVMRERGAVRVVYDQVGAPTCASSIARVLWKMAAQPDLHGIHHWTDAGVASRYDFAIAIAEEATLAGCLDRAIDVQPITTAEYPTPARRPRFGVLDCATTRARTHEPWVHWRTQLRAVMQEIARA
jgi:dTDP-4-dehydrorhamnose reductase